MNRRSPEIYNFQLLSDLTRLGLLSQQVIGLRLFLIGLGGRRGRSEIRRMVIEKADVGIEAAAAMLLDGPSAATAVYRRAVTNNRRRLAPQ